MASERVTPGLLDDRASASSELGTEWRRLTRAATAVAIITSPAPFVWFHSVEGWSIAWSLVATFFTVIAFRGMVDLMTRRMLPWPSLYGTDDEDLKEEDVVNRRRASFWRSLLKFTVLVLGFFTLIWLIHVLVPGGSTSWVESTVGMWDGMKTYLNENLGTLFIFPLFFLFNFLIFFGPMMLIGITQMRGFEPGDADWGVRLGDVRGQDEAKQEVGRVVSLWQSGEAFEEAGGKRERGLLLLGAPGTGKTMLAKAIATSFNCPFISMPGSGFQQTFMGMDAVIVRWLAWKAKKLARKWGGQCIVFIDEIDAVGMRRSALGGAGGGAGIHSGNLFQDALFYGPHGALNPSGDMILETRAWRDRLFAEREGKPAPPKPGRLAAILNQGGVMPGMMGGMGQLALNQLLVVMDGIDNPPFFRRFFTNRINTFLDATYIIPRRARRVSLRIPRPKPRKDQIYFIGATNVPIDVLDPALTRPGRMGRHVWLRTPTKHDRKDIFDLYIRKVAHEPDLDTEKRRDELARITSGYSPAMIEQVCSMALTLAHSDRRERFDYEDIFEAMTTVESGTAINIEYAPDETKAVAIHEAGHAAASHVFMKDAESTRISIRMRGGSLGHHQAAEQVERFSQWRSDQMAILIWGLGAMAAERVFYGQTSSGVGGDVQSVTYLSALMVGAAGMGPEPLDLDEGLDSMEEDRVLKRFEDIGLQIMNRTGGGGPFAHDPVASVLSDRDKRKTAAQILGQAYVTAHNLILHNRGGIEHIADQVVARREIYGDDLLKLLNEAKLKAPRVDLLEEASWPML